MTMEYFITEVLNITSSTVFKTYLWARFRLSAMWNFLCFNLHLSYKTLIVVLWYVTIKEKLADVSFILTLQSLEAN